MSEDIQMPHASDVEQALIGCLLLDGSLAHELCARVPAESFYVAKHQRLWGILAQMADGGEPIDVLTVRSRVREWMPTSELNEIASSVPSTVNATEYARLVEEKADARELLKAVEKAMEDLMHGVATHDIRARLDAVVQDSPQRDMMVGIDQVGNAFMNRGPGSSGLPLGPGLSDLEGATGGIYEGLNAISGMPGAGKTTIAIQIINRSLLNGEKAVIFSADQSKEDLFGIMWQNAARQQDDRLMTGEGWELPFRELTGTACQFYQGKMELGDILATLRTYASLGYKLVLIDYLGLISVPRTRTSHEASEVAIKALKRAAHELELKIILIISFTKVQDGGSPKLQNARGTMEVGHAPDQVWMMESPDDPQGPTTVHVVKSRKKARCRVQLSYQGARRCFGGWNLR